MSQSPIIDGSVMVLEIERLLRRHVLLRESEYVVLAAWIIHTYAFRLFRHTPYLLIVSVEKQSGKTTLIDLLFVIVANPKRADSASPAVLYRMADALKPTLMLDEVDAMTKGNKEVAEATRGILNSGFHHKGEVYRCTGKNMDTLAGFSTFCPKVLAGIGKVPDTIHDRSITIRMRRMSPSETVEPIDEESLEPLVSPLRKSIDAWVIKNTARLKARPDRLVNVRSQRQQDIAVPLLAVANTIGGDYPARLRSALAELFSSAPAEDQSHRVALLADIRRVFAERGTEKVFTADLISDLKGIEDAPWSDWSKGKGISAHDLASILKDFEIEPRKVRLGSTTKQGYSLDTFNDAFGRYLPEPKEEDTEQ